MFWLSSFSLFCPTEYGGFPMITRMSSFFCRVRRAPLSASISDTRSSFS